MSSPQGQGAYTSYKYRDPVPLAGPSGPLSGGLLATSFGNLADRKPEQVESVALMNDYFGNIRRLGSAAIDICMVADGTQDAYAECGIQEHDWAGAALIAEEAGVTVRRPTITEVGAQPDWCIIGNIGTDPAHLKPTPLTSRGTHGQ